VLSPVVIGVIVLGEATLEVVGLARVPLAGRPTDQDVHGVRHGKLPDRNRFEGVDPVSGAVWDRGE
jgi:hypothetical protein